MSAVSNSSALAVRVYLTPGQEKVGKQGRISLFPNDSTGIDYKIKNTFKKALSNININKPIEKQRVELRVTIGNNSQTIHVRVDELAKKLGITNHEQIVGLAKAGMLENLVIEKQRENLDEIKKNKKEKLAGELGITTAKLEKMEKSDFQEFQNLKTQKKQKDMLASGLGITTTLLESMEKTGSQQLQVLKDAKNKEVEDLLGEILNGRINKFDDGLGKPTSELQAATNEDVDKVVDALLNPDIDAHNLGKEMGKDVKFSDDQKASIKQRATEKQKEDIKLFHNELPNIKNALNAELSELTKQATNSPLGTVRTTIKYNDGGGTLKEVQCSVNKDGSYYIDIPSSFIGKGQSKIVSLSMHSNGLLYGHALIKRERSFAPKGNDPTHKDLAFQAQQGKIQGDKTVMDHFKSASNIHTVQNMGAFQINENRKIVNNPNEFSGSLEAPGTIYFEVYSDICTNGDLNAKFNNPDTPTPTILNHALEVCDSIEQMHAENITYNDLKPENCFVGNKGQAILADFDTVKNLNKLHEAASSKKSTDADKLALQNACNKTEGSPIYMAPEKQNPQRCLAVDFARNAAPNAADDAATVEKKERVRLVLYGGEPCFPGAAELFNNDPLEVAKKGDVYTLGMFIWAGLYQKCDAQKDPTANPWGINLADKEGLIKAKIEGYNPKPNEKYPNMGKKGPIEDVVAKLLQPDVSKRPTMAEAKQLLKDIYLEQVAWEKEQGKGLETVVNFGGVRERNAQRQSPPSMPPVNEQPAVSSSSSNSSMPPVNEQSVTSPSNSRTQSPPRRGGFSIGTRGKQQ